MVKIERAGRDLLLTVGENARVEDVADTLFWEDLYLEIDIDRVCIVDYNNKLVYDTNISPWRGDSHHLQAMEGKTTLLTPYDKETSLEIIEDIASLKWA